MSNHTHVARLMRGCCALLAARARGGGAPGGTRSTPAAAALLTRAFTTTQQQATGGGGADESPLPDPAPGVIEMRQYALKPSGVRDYLALTQQSAAVRRQHLPLAGFFQAELGGDLTTLTHFYAYPGGLDERAERRREAQADPRWQAYVAASRAFVRGQENAALVEWGSLYGPAGGDWASAAEYAARSSSSLSGPPKSPGVYEMRTYRLSATASIRRLVRAFERGLPAKVAAARRELDPDGAGGPGAWGELALFGSVEVGDLDTVVELWRYPSAEACARARRASRAAAPEWRAAVASVATGVSEFKVQLLTPVLPLSPMR